MKLKALGTSVFLSFKTMKVAYPIIWFGYDIRTYKFNSVAIHRWPTKRQDARYTLQQETAMWLDWKAASGAAPVTPNPWGPAS